MDRQLTGPKGWGAPGHNDTLWPQSDTNDYKVMKKSCETAKKEAKTASKDTNRAQKDCKDKKIQNDLKEMQLVPK